MYRTPHQTTLQTPPGWDRQVLQTRRFLNHITPRNNQEEGEIQFFKNVNEMSSRHAMYNDIYLINTVMY